MVYIIDTPHMYFAAAICAIRGGACALTVEAMVATKGMSTYGFPITGCSPT